LLNWTFTQKKTTRPIICKTNIVPVSGNLIVEDVDVSTRAAVDGLGLAYTLETSADIFIRSGHLVRVLEDWSPAFDGMYLYYPGKRQVPPALRALIDMVKTSQTGTTPTGQELPFIELLPGRAANRSKNARPSRAAGPKGPPRRSR
jgi:DNA-binding transcriptional LysR family regulator